MHWEGTVDELARHSGPRERKEVIAALKGTTTSERDAKEKLARSIRAPGDGLVPTPDDRRRSPEDLADVSRDGLAAALRQRLVDRGLTPVLSKKGVRIVPLATPGESNNSPAYKALADNVVAITLRRKVLSALAVDRKSVFEFDDAKAVSNDLVRNGATAHDAEMVAASFDYQARVLRIKFAKDVDLLRVFGEGGNATGRWYFCCLHSSAEDASSDFKNWSDASGLALPPKNPASNLARVTIPKGTVAHVGVVADNFGNMGGNVQVFVDKVQNFPFEQYTAGGENDPNDIAIRFDGDRLVRYHRRPRPKLTLPHPRLSLPPSVAH